MTTIDNSQDVMDSRDIIERLDELRTELVDAHESESDANEPDHFDDWLAAMAANDEGTLQDAAQELIALQKFADQLEGYGDWEHGETVIREDYFTKYTEELIDDCYPDAAKAASSEWPFRHMSLDIEAAADELKSDYTEADFDGVTYLMRA